MVWWCFPSGSLNYKLSIDVDDNGTVHHGEGVIKVTYQSNGFLRTPETPLWSVGPVGQAIAVDLGAKGTLFVLLAADPTRVDRFGIINPTGKPNSAEAGRVALIEYFNFYFNDLPNDRSGIAIVEDFKAKARSAEVRSGDLPMLVRFRDINDPATIEKVDPSHLDLTFGPGVSIIRSNVEITNGPVTSGIEKKLPFWNGPFPWLKPSGTGSSIDTKANEIHFLKQQFDEGTTGSG